jgi:hypothetical protein
MTSAPRVHRPGGGRKSAVAHQPGLPSALEALIEDAIRGDPATPLRWVSRSLRDDLRSFPAAAPTHGRSRLSTRSRESLPDLATGNLRPSGGVMACCRPPISRTRLRIG